jgi:hypothetical protein
MLPGLQYLSDLNTDEVRYLLVCWTPAKPSHPATCQALYRPWRGSTNSLGKVQEFQKRSKIDHTQCSYHSLNFFSLATHHIPSKVRVCFAKQKNWTSLSTLYCSAARITHKGRMVIFASYQKLSSIFIKIDDLASFLSETSLLSSSCTSSSSSSSSFSSCCCFFFFPPRKNDDLASFVSETSL